ncbi:MAG: alpha/beta hydrolase, partial [Beijerinckiaceae bacterium]
PEIEGFLSIAAMANRYDYTFLAPCPSSGLFVHGEIDRVSPAKESMTAIDKVKVQKGIKIEHQIVPGANHFYEDKLDDLMTVVSGYLDKRQVLKV